MKARINIRNRMKLEYSGLKRLLRVRPHKECGFKVNVLHLHQKNKSKPPC